MTQVITRLEGHLALPPGSGVRGTGRVPRRHELDAPAQMRLQDVRRAPGTARKSSLLVRTERGGRRRSAHASVPAGPTRTRRAGPTPKARTSCSHSERRSMACSRSRTGDCMPTAYPATGIGIQQTMAHPAESRTWSSFRTRDEENAPGSARLEQGELLIYCQDGGGSRVYGESERRARSLEVADRRHVPARSPTPSLPNREVASTGFDSRRLPISSDTPYP